MSDIHERLKKLRTLALKGVGGEQAQAQALLDKLTQKYGIAMEDLDDEKLERYEFSYSTMQEQQILDQIAYKVTNRTDIYYKTADKRYSRNKEWIECTEAHKIEIEFLYEFYRDLWARECAAFLNAFIQKHELFGQRKESTPAKEYQKEELLKMYAMMAGMDDKTPLHQIEGQRNETNL